MLAAGSIEFERRANLEGKASIAYPSLFKGAIFKQNFPSSFQVNDLVFLSRCAVGPALVRAFSLSVKQQEYDLVTSAFTLIELANMKERLESIERLWEKLANNGYLVRLVVSKS